MTPASPAAAPRAVILAAVALSGAAVMIVEMTAVRAMQPFFGSTTLVWTNVIAVVLAALAAGSAVGGRLAERRPSAALLFGLMAAGGILVAAGALLATPVSRLLLADGVDLLGVTSALARGSLAATLLLFAPPLFLLGTVCPLAFRLLADGGVGRAAGNVLSVSTAGSILGTYLPTLVLVPHLGSRGSLLVAAALLLLPGAIGLAVWGRPRGPAAAALLLVVGGASAFGEMRPARGAPTLPDGGTATVLAERESPYQYLTVRDDRLPGEAPFRVLTINEGVTTYHSLKVEGQVLTQSRCYDDYTLLPLLLDLPPGVELRLGVVGFACGVNASQWRHFWEGPFRLRITGAELDPEVLALGREFFALPAETPGVVAADGRPWLAFLPPGERFHALVLDAFAHELYVPFHLGTREFFDLCRGRLEPGGLLAMNVYAVGAGSPNLRALENTVATSFGSCLRVPQYGGENFVLLARNGEGPPDLAGLSTERARARFGAREGTSEWPRLLEQAAEASFGATIVRPDPAAPVLTDDHAPLEWLTDRFLGDLEGRILAGEPGRADALRALFSRQRHALLLAGALWGLLLAGAWRVSAIDRIRSGVPCSGAEAGKESE